MKYISLQIILCYQTTRYSRLEKILLELLIMQKLIILCELIELMIMILVLIHETLKRQLRREQKRCVTTQLLPYQRDRLLLKYLSFQKNIKVRTQRYLGLKFSLLKIDLEVHSIQQLVLFNRLPHSFLQIPKRYTR